MGRRFQLHGGAARAVRQDPSRGFAAAAILADSSRGRGERDSLVSGARHGCHLLQPDAVGTSDRQFQRGAPRQPSSGRLAAPLPALPVAESGAGPRAPRCSPSHSRASRQHGLGGGDSVGSSLAGSDGGDRGSTCPRADRWMGIGCEDATHSGGSGGDRRSHRANGRRIGAGASSW